MSSETDEDMERPRSPIAISKRKNKMLSIYSNSVYITSNTVIYVTVHAKRGRF